MEPRSSADQANQQLVDYLIAEGALWSPRLIAAFRATPRHRFLDRVYQFHAKSQRWRESIVRAPGATELRLIYSDRALITHLGPAQRDGVEVPISSSSQPSLMAQMLEDLHLAPGQRVLEIGAGTGYNAALLAHVVGPDRVTTIDVDRDVLSEAWDHLRAFPERRIQLQHADGRLGLAAAAPFDRLMVTAATPQLEVAWLEQLADAGRLSAPLVLAPGLAFVVCGTVQAGIFTGRPMRAAYFMPLRAEDEVGASDDATEVNEDRLQTVPAPWADWLDRRRGRLSWLRLVQALAFYGLLRGLTIDYRSQPDGQPVFGVQDGEGRCWFAPQHWQVDGRHGRELGGALWRAFLDAGGPWPIEFQLRIAVRGEVDLRGSGEEYVRRTSGAPQAWELIDRRQRSNWI